SRPSRTCTCPALRAVLAWWSCQEPSGLCGDFGRYAVLYNSFCPGTLPDARGMCDVRDVRGADPVAVRDRSEPLHRRAEQPAKRLGFRLAQLRELGRHVRDRAVVLAELLAGRGAYRRRRAGGGGVAVGGQRLGQRLDPDA